MAKLQNPPLHLLGVMNAFERIAVVLLSMIVACSPVQAYIAVPQIFGSHMVLQADTSLPVWGTASPGEQVTVKLADLAKTVRADLNGKWQVKFPPLKATTLPISMSVSGSTNKIILEDILVGEVWICAGQSNMEWPLKKSKRGQKEVTSAAYQHIRFLNLVGAARGGSGKYTAEHLARMKPELFSRGSWAICNPKSARDFSAVGYYFGRKLHKELDIPVGLISPAIGGTPAEAWIRQAAMATDDQLAPLVQGNWLKNSRLDPWCQQRAISNFQRARAANEEIPGDDLGPYHSFKPGFMWKAGIEPLVPFAIRGVVWYQGESNAATHWRAQQHSQIFPLLVRDWRQQWGQSDFPFLYVQLPALGRPHWPVFREGQRRLLETLPNLGMAVTMDVGHPTNVHPTEKQPVGERLARWALAMTYVRRDIIPSGPLFREMRLKGHQATLDFNYTAEGLSTSDQLPPIGFEVAENDGPYHAAEAQIEGDSITVSSNEVSDIQRIRYGWQAYPDPPLNLVNSEGLPASPFTTETSLHEARN